MLTIKSDKDRTRQLQTRMNNDTKVPDKIWASWIQQHKIEEYTTTKRNLFQEYKAGSKLKNFTRNSPHWQSKEERTPNLTHWWRYKIQRPTRYAVSARLQGSSTQQRASTQSLQLTALAGGGTEHPPGDEERGRHALAHQHSAPHWSAGQAGEQERGTQAPGLYGKYKTVPPHKRATAKNKMNKIQTGPSWDMSSSRSRDTRPTLLYTQCKINKKQ